MTSWRRPTLLMVALVALAACGSDGSAGEADGTQPPGGHPGEPGDPGDAAPDAQQPPTEMPESSELTPRDPEDVLDPDDALGEDGEPPADVEMPDPDLPVVEDELMVLNSTTERVETAIGPYGGTIVTARDGQLHVVRFPVDRVEELALIRHQLREDGLGASFNYADEEPTGSPSDGA